MASTEWLSKAWKFGYTSGNVTSRIPGIARLIDEFKCGGSYKKVFQECVLPYIDDDSKILELGPGRGSWTKAMVKHVPNGEIHVVDYLDVSKWMKSIMSKRVFCHMVSDNGPYDFLEDQYFDFCWSFGVLCHNDSFQIEEVLSNTIKKLKPGGTAVHQYGNWDKLNAFGWFKGGIPKILQAFPDDMMWWPKNDIETMKSLAENTGWEIVCADKDLLRRDSIIVLKKPVKKPADTYPLSSVLED